MQILLRRIASRALKEGCFPAEGTDEMLPSANKSGHGTAASARVGEPSGEALWNKREALERLGGDEVLFRELCGIFVEESPKLLEKLRQAIAADDPEAVMRAAHSLKGELGYLGAKVATQASRELEDMGHEKNMGRVPEVFVLLERELGNVCLAIKDLIGVMR